MKKQFEESELPWKELENLGFYKTGSYALKDEDYNALLSGRRTNFVTTWDMRSDQAEDAYELSSKDVADDRLYGYRDDNFIPTRVQVKLSLERNPAGEIHVKTHHVLNRAFSDSHVWTAAEVAAETKQIVASYSPLLTATEAEQLMTGKKADRLTKPILNAQGEAGIAIIEYDQTIRDFIVTNSRNITPPSEVDGMPLTTNQQEAYKSGQLVNLEDGTQLQYTGKNAQGLISNQSSLVLSYIEGDSISYSIPQSIKGFDDLKESFGFSKGHESVFASVGELCDQGLLQTNSRTGISTGDKAVCENFFELKRQGLLGIERKEFFEGSIQWEDLEELGLYRDGVCLLKEDDLNALLSGRRTDFITLSNMPEDGGITDKMPVKLSLCIDDRDIHQPRIKIHPILKEDHDAPLLTAAESEQLRIGKDSDRFTKPFLNIKAEQDIAIIEYDKETREFILANAKGITPPSEVDGMPLTAIQQEAYKNGELVELADGTQLQHTEKNAQGMLANRESLVLGYIQDDRVSYSITQSIKGFDDQKKNYDTGKGYNAACERINELGDQKLLKINPKTGILTGSKAACKDFIELKRQGINQKVVANTEQKATWKNSLELNKQVMPKNSRGRGR